MKTLLLFLALFFGVQLFFFALPMAVINFLGLAVFAVIIFVLFRAFWRA
jgi:hypothetical protein